MPFSPFFLGLIGERKYVFLYCNVTWLKPWEINQMLKYIKFQAMVSFHGAVRSVRV